MNNDTTTNSSIQTIAFGARMPLCGHDVLGATWVTGRRPGDLRIPVIARLRAVAPASHLGLTAHVPGVHTWSPPV